MLNNRLSVWIPSQQPTGMPVYTTYVRNGKLDAFCSALQCMGQPYTMTVHVITHTAMTQSDASLTASEHSTFQHGAPSESYAHVHTKTCVVF